METAFRTRWVWFFGQTKLSQNHIKIQRPLMAGISNNPQEKAYERI